MSDIDTPSLGPCLNQDHTLLRARAFPLASNSSSFNVTPVTAIVESRRRQFCCLELTSTWPVVMWACLF